MPDTPVLDFLITRPGITHERSRICPRCGDDLARVGLVQLVYVFTACTEPHVNYSHLYEQLWHIDCFRAEEPHDA